MTDVAELAGVSHQTVSRVVNENAHVTADTRARVQDAIAELGYRRNQNARALATGRSHLIGVLTQHSTLYGPSSVLEAIGRAAQEADFAVTIGHLRDYDETSVLVALGRLIDQGVAGLVVVAPIDTAAQALRRLGEDIVLVAIDTPSIDPGLAVRVDQHGGAVAATAHLLEHGHRAVWHVAGPRQWNDARAREAGWRDTLHAAGVTPPPVVRAQWSAESGYAAGRELAARPEVTAVFAANDHLALGVLRALAEAGRQVPDEVSVVGFDDVPESAFFHPPLTTVRQDFPALGRAALELLLDRRAGGRAGSVTIAPTLVRRATVAAAPG